MIIVSFPSDLPNVVGWNMVGVEFNAPPDTCAVLLGNMIIVSCFVFAIVCVKKPYDVSIKLIKF